jgi:hypothetical protein
MFPVLPAAYSMMPQAARRRRSRPTDRCSLPPGFVEAIRLFRFDLVAAELARGAEWHFEFLSVRQQIRFCRAVELDELWTVGMLVQESLRHLSENFSVG